MICERVTEDARVIVRPPSFVAVFSDGEVSELAELLAGSFPEELKMSIVEGVVEREICVVVREGDEAVFVMLLRLVCDADCPLPGVLKSAEDALSAREFDVGEAVRWFKKNRPTLRGPVCLERVCAGHG